MKKVIGLALLFLTAISISYAIGRRDMYDASDFELVEDGGRVYIIWYKGEPYQYKPSLKY